MSGFVEETWTLTDEEKEQRDDARDLCQSMLRTMQHHLDKAIQLRKQAEDADRVAKELEDEKNHRTFRLLRRLARARMVDEKRIVVGQEPKDTKDHNLTVQLYPIGKEDTK